LVNDDDEFIDDDDDDDDAELGIGLDPGRERSGMTVCPVQFS